MRIIKLLFCFSLLTLSSSFFTLSSAQTWQWARAATNNITGSYTDAFDLTTDRSGNIYEMGGYAGNVNFGSINMNISINAVAPYLVKFDNSGNPIWGVGGQAIFEGISGGVATGKSGNVCMVGFYSDTMRIGAYTFPGYFGCTSLFVATFNSAGSLKWAAHSVPALGNSNIQANGVSIDNKGNTCITGYFYDTVEIASYHLHGNSNYCFFVAKYDTMGNMLWLKTANTSTFNQGNSIVTDTAGNIYVMGQYQDSLRLGSTKITTKGVSNNFIAKYTPAGNLSWLTSPTLPNHSCYALVTVNLGGRFLCLDSTGNLYTEGVFKDTAIFGADTMINPHQEVYLAKYTTAGNVKWVRGSTIENPTSAPYNTPYSISMDKQGSIYMSGTFADSLGFNSIKVVSDSASPSFLFKFDTSGTALCGAAIDNYNDDNNAVAGDPLGNGVFYSGDIENAHNQSDSAWCYFGSYALKGIHEYAFLAEFTCGTDAEISEIQNSGNQVSIFPNPNSGAFTIGIRNKEQGISKIQIDIYNVLGEKVFTETLRSAQGDNLIDLSGEPNGIYLYRVLYDDGSVLGSGKVMIQK